MKLILSFFAIEYVHVYNYILHDVLIFSINYVLLTLVRVLMYKYQEYIRKKSVEQQ